ncbi:uncharacterized protein LOC143041493 isoform X2 [Oratosquilla oratoria]|uniref:uncharacterized protein LOC143041493 isoform X2 n=1 Tax=Oratosquilla oratoria TaxID=337810 RepID=UPI003F75AA84
MGEKGDNMTPETVSLPPTYAPSETYTESPPPAYQKPRASWVQVVRMVCMTVLAAAFLIGFFILTSAWLQARNTCNCQEHQVDGPIRSASFGGLAPRHEQLVGKVALDKNEGFNLDMNNNLEEEDKGSEEVSAEEQEDEQPEDDPADFETGEQDIVVPEQELEVLDEILEEDAFMEEERRQLEEEMRAQMQEMRKRVQLPVNLLLGNPMLAGREVNCEVERRQQQLAPGILSKIIVVTCDNDGDDDDDDSTESEEIPQLLQVPSPLEGRLMPPMLRPVPEIGPSAPKRLGPPFSLLAPILKMIAARESAKNQVVPEPLPPIASMPRATLEPVARFHAGPEPKEPIAGPPTGGRARELTVNRIPIPFGPLRFISGAPRVLNMPPFMQEPRRRDGPIITPQGPMSQGPMRLQGLVPLRILPEPLLPLQPRPMPEARGRALSSPVNLPPFNLRLLNLPLPPFMKPKMELKPRIMPITHMEMMHPHHQQEEEEEVEELQQPFQPPQFLRVPPPPPGFAPDGRHGIITEIEPDAEIIHSGPRHEDPMHPHFHPGFQMPHSHPEPHPHPHFHPHPQPQHLHNPHPEMLLPPPPPFHQAEHQPFEHIGMENHHHEHPHQDAPMPHPPLLFSQPQNPLRIHKVHPAITFTHPPVPPQQEHPSHTKVIHQPPTHAVIHQSPPQPLHVIHEAPSHTQVIHEPSSHTQVIHEEPSQPQPIHEEPPHPQTIHLPPPPQPSHPEMVHNAPPHPMTHDIPAHPPMIHDIPPQLPVLHDAPPQPQPEGRSASLERRAADDPNRHTLLVLN